MTHVPPCAASDTPNDWFITKDGRQYPDDVFLTEADIQTLTRSALAKVGETEESHTERVELALKSAAASRKLAALAARQAAKAACYGCEMRVACLTRALDQNIVHGTWGGYFEEELLKVRRERDRRNR